MSHASQLTSDMQTTVSMVDVEFHNSDVIIGLKPREQHPKWGNWVNRTPMTSILQNV